MEIIVVYIVGVLLSLLGSVAVAKKYKLGRGPTDEFIVGLFCLLITSLFWPVSGPFVLLYIAARNIQWWFS